MKIIGIIPARYASSRFPGKPLVDINGKSMIQRVCEQVSLSEKIGEIIVATDDIRIKEHVISLGYKVCMTSEMHNSGTERCNEAAGTLIDNIDIVINIQGDEPFINPAQIDALADCFQSDETQIASLKKRITDTDELFDPNVVKVITDCNNHAIYFSRSAIPFVRSSDKKLWLQHQIHFKHVGIYAYRKKVLNEIVKLPSSLLESMESLEQLRWIENGYKIKVEETAFESVSIDTPYDLKKLVF